MEGTDEPTPDSPSVSSLLWLTPGDSLGLGCPKGGSCENSQVSQHRSRLSPSRSTPALSQICCHLIRKLTPPRGFWGYGPQ